MHEKILIKISQSISPTEGQRTMQPSINNKKQRATEGRVASAGMIPARIQRDQDRVNFGYMPAPRGLTAYISSCCWYSKVFSKLCKHSPTAKKQKVICPVFKKINTLGYYAAL
ncbi:MAG: hypothetical protein PHN64_07820 [Desulfovibrionaceae bacterium]|nr:hypothetical protein [Desulfovibrionaceae bacterium]